MSKTLRLYFDLVTSTPTKKVILLWIILGKKGDSCFYKTRSWYRQTTLLGRCKKRDYVKTYGPSWTLFIHRSSKNRNPNEFVVEGVRRRITLYIIIGGVQQYNYVYRNARPGFCTTTSLICYNSRSSARNPAKECGGKLACVRARNAYLYLRPSRND